MGYQHLEITRDGHVATLWLNRPEKLNALSEDMWQDIPKAIADLDEDGEIRVIVLAGRGTAFTVGIDIGMLAGLQPTGRRRRAGRGGGGAARGRDRKRRPGLTAGVQEGSQAGAGTVGPWPPSCSACCP